MAKKLDVIQTERLTLRGIKEEDTIEIVKWRSNPEVFKYFKFPHKITIKEHLDWYKNYYIFNNNRCDWMCIEKKSGNKIGIFGLVNREENTEINYLLAPEAQHKGFAAEGIIAVMLFAADVWKVNQIIAEIHLENMPSIAVVKKLGFSLQSSKGKFVTYRIEV